MRPHLALLPLTLPTGDVSVFRDSASKVELSLPILRADEIQESARGIAPVNRQTFTKHKTLAPSRACAALLPTHGNHSTQFAPYMQAMLARILVKDAKATPFCQTLANFSSTLVEAPPDPTSRADLAGISSDVTEEVDLMVEFCKVARLSRKTPSSSTTWSPASAYTSQITSVRTSMWTAIWPRTAPSSEVMPTAPKRMSWPTHSRSSSEPQPLPSRPSMPSA